MAHILVLEDDLALSAGLCFELDACGHLTVAATTARRPGSCWRRRPSTWLSLT